MGTICLSFKTRSRSDLISSCGGGGGGGLGGGGLGGGGFGGGGGGSYITDSQSKCDDGGGGAGAAFLRATTICVPFDETSEPSLISSCSMTKVMPSSSSNPPVESRSMYMLHRFMQSHDFTVSVTFVKDAVY